MSVQYQEYPVNDERWWNEAVLEIKRLKSCIRFHRDIKGDDRCRLDDLKLYHDALGEGVDPFQGALPPDECMLESCRRYIEQRKNPEHTALMPDEMTIAQLTDEVARLRTLVDEQVDRIERLMKLENLADFAKTDRIKHLERIVAEKNETLRKLADEEAWAVYDEGYCWFDSFETDPRDIAQSALEKE